MENNQTVKNECVAMFDTTDFFTNTKIQAGISCTDLILILAVLIRLDN